MSEEEPKIFVDSDWKDEAQKEKQRLEQETKGLGSEALPAASFLEIVNMLAMQAMIGLGGLKTPDGKQIAPDINMAKHHIDLLEILQGKTTGNLDEQEQKMLDATLHEIRLAFVHMSGAAGAVPEQPEKP